MPRWDARDPCLPLADKPSSLSLSRAKAQAFRVCTAHESLHQLQLNKAPLSPSLDQLMHQQLTRWAGSGSTQQRQRFSSSLRLLHSTSSQIDVTCKARSSGTSTSLPASSEGSSYTLLEEALANLWLGQLTLLKESRPLLPVFVCKLGWQAVRLGGGVARPGSSAWGGWAEGWGHSRILPQHNSMAWPQPSSFPPARGRAGRAARCCACRGCPALLRKMRGNKFSSGVI